MSASVHISLNASDLGRSVDFYRRLLGDPTKLNADYAKFVASDPEIHLALQPALLPGMRGGALSHLGIRVDSSDEVRRWHAALSERGVATEGEKQESCCYAVQDKFWLTDPDGNRWEIYTVLKDVESADAGAAACCTPEGTCAGAALPIRR